MGIIIPKSEQEIIDNVKSKGSRDCALKAFKQGKPIFICNPDKDDVKEVSDKILKRLNND